MALAELMDEKRNAYAFDENTEESFDIAKNEESPTSDQLDGDFFNIRERGK